MSLISALFAKKNRVKVVKEKRLSFSEWYGLAEKTISERLYATPDQRLWMAFPDDYSSDNDPMLADVMSKLETGLLKTGAEKFRSRWNCGIENADITEMRIAWNEFFMTIKSAWLLIDRIRFPEYLSNRFEEQLIDAIEQIQLNIEKTTKDAVNETGSGLYADAYYMVIKHRLSEVWST